MCYRHVQGIGGHIPVTTEPSIDPTLKYKIEAVHNSVAGHFGVEYTRKVLLGRGVNDEGLRRAVTKYVRECPVCQLRMPSVCVVRRWSTLGYLGSDDQARSAVGPH